MEMDVHIFWDHRAPQGLAGPVGRSIAAITGTTVQVNDNPIVLTGYIGQRKQVDAGIILDSLGTYLHRQGIRGPVLLVIGQDLFATGHEFVFGLARPPTQVSLVSSVRLCNEYYGRHPDDEDLVERLAREGSHELGHIYGLSHCSNHECIMFNPHTLDELDGKKKEFCPACSIALERGKEELLSANGLDIFR
jgi:archaemetzincin